MKKKLKVSSSVHETKTITKSVELSTGGLVEIELDESGRGYLKIHLGKNESHHSAVTQRWRWIQFGDDEKNIKLLAELRDATNVLLESMKAE